MRKRIDKIPTEQEVREMFQTATSCDIFEFFDSLLNLRSNFDDYGGGDGLWKGRAILFVMALSRALVYLRDNGYIELTPEVFLSYFELEKAKELAGEHGGKYGEGFVKEVRSLSDYIDTVHYDEQPEHIQQRYLTIGFHIFSTQRHSIVASQLTNMLYDVCPGCMLAERPGPVGTKTTQKRRKRS